MPIPIFFQHCDALRSIAPDAVNKAITDSLEGKLPHCGIVVYGVARELALVSGIPEAILPPPYEQFAGEPGKFGWNSTQAREYVLGALGLPLV